MAVYEAIWGLSVDVGGRMSVKGWSKWMSNEKMREYLPHGHMVHKGDYEERFIGGVREWRVPTHRKRGFVPNYDEVV